MNKSNKVQIESEFFIQEYEHLSEEEAEGLDKTDNQHLELENLLIRWYTHAVNVLESYCYGDRPDFNIPELGGLFCHPIGVDPNEQLKDNHEARDAYDIVNRASYIWRLLTDKHSDKATLILAGIDLGNALTRGHVRPHEKNAVKGRKRIEQIVGARDALHQKNRDAKEFSIKIAIDSWREDESTPKQEMIDFVVEMLVKDGFKKYSDRTIWGWISEKAPAHVKKPGRRKKNK